MEQTNKLAIVITRGLDDERSSVAWSIANGGVASGFEVTIFLAAAGVDWVRKGAGEVARLNPLDPPIGEMITNVLENGGKIMVCPPCAKVRAYSEDDLIDGAVLAGAPSMLEVVKQGASTLSF
jgi:predicted peroxiredoxin